MTTPSPSSAGDDQPVEFRYPSLLPHLPLLSRGPGELQVGFDQPMLVLVGVHPALIRVLRLLDGSHSIARIQVEAAQLGVGATELTWCLRNLRQARMLVDGGSVAEQQPPRFRVRLVGAGRLARSVARMLVVGEVTALHVVDLQPPDPQLYPAAGPVGSQAEALVASLVGTDGTRLATANHWSKPEDRALDLTIIASDLLECDRVVADGLLRLDQPHLVVRPVSQGVLVGPLVVPGRTACLRCTDLARRDLDPAWPHLLNQLQRIRVPVREAMASWAGAVAAAQALAFLHGSQPETYGATLDLSTPDYLTRWRSWPMHPDCGCGWGALAEWAS